MPVDVDTFTIPFGQTQQQNAQEASTPGYYARRDLEAQQVNRQSQEANRPITDKDYAEAMLSPEQRAQLRAEEEARIDLGKEEYDPGYFERINRAAREEQLTGDVHESYYAQQRETVATPQTTQSEDSVTYEKVEQWAEHPEVNLPHLGRIGQIVKSERTHLLGLNKENFELAA